jgi:hypothetical protein
MTSIHTAYGGTLSLTTSPMTVGWIFSIPSKGGQAITAEAVILSLTIRCREQKEKAVIIEMKK